MYWIWKIFHFKFGRLGSWVQFNTWPSDILIAIAILLHSNSIEGSGSFALPFTILLANLECQDLYHFSRFCHLLSFHRYVWKFSPTVDNLGLNKLSVWNLLDFCFVSLIWQNSTLILCCFPKAKLASIVLANNFPGKYSWIFYVAWNSFPMIKISDISCHFLLSDFISVF